MQDLQNKIIWITGASSGIGKALAEVCAQLGAQVILSARRADELEQVRQSLQSPEKHVVLPMDVSKESDVLHAYTQIIENLGGHVDWLINNAGVSQRALVEDTSMETERAIMEVDYFGPVLLSKMVLPIMLQRGQGRIVFISSVAGLLGTQYRATYSAAKGAIHMWANSLRAEVADRGVGVSVIFPGFVKTNVSLNALNGEGQARNTQDDAIENGLDPQQFALQAVKSLLAGEEYIVLGGFKEKLGVAMSRLSPSLLYKMIRKSTVK